MSSTRSRSSRSGGVGSVRLIRFIAFDGTNLQFMDGLKPISTEVLPLNSGYHTLASQIPQGRLCKATVLDGRIEYLQLTEIRSP